MNISNWVQKPHIHYNNRYANSIRSFYCTTNTSSVSSKNVTGGINTEINNSTATTTTVGSKIQEKVVIDDVHNKHFINNEWMEKRVKPIISFRTGKILTVVTCTLAFYFSIITEYGDEDKETIVTGIRNYHDKLVYEWFGIDARKTLRELDSNMRDLITVKPLEEKFPQEAIDKINQVKQQQGIDINNNNNNKTSAITASSILSQISNDIKNDTSSSEKPTNKKISEVDRIDEIMRKSRMETLKMEQEMNIIVDKVLNEKQNK